MSILAELKLTFKIAAKWVLQQSRCQVMTRFVQAIAKHYL